MKVLIEPHAVKDGVGTPEEEAADRRHDAIEDAIRELEAAVKQAKHNLALRCLTPLRAEAALTAAQKLLAATGDKDVLINWQGVAFAVACFAGTEGRRRIRRIIEDHSDRSEPDNQATLALLERWSD